MRVACAIVGTLLITFGALLYPTEQRQVQSQLEDLWCRVGDARMRSVSWLAAIVQAAAGETLGFIGMSFGPALSARALLTAYVVAFISSTVAYQVSTFADVLGSLVIISLAVTAMRNVRITHLAAWFITAVMLALLLSMPNMYWLQMSSILLGVSTELLALFIIRLLLQRASQSPSNINVIVLFVVTALIVVTFYIVPVHSYTTLRWLDEHFSRNVWVGVHDWGETNLFIAAICLFASAVAISLLIYVLLGQLAERALFAVADVEVFKYRKLIIGIGLALVAVALPQLQHVIAFVRAAG